MHRRAVIAAIFMSLPVQAAVGQDALPITNVTINMIKHGGKGPVRVDARMSNPNDFTVFDVRIRCDIKDRRGNQLVSYTSTITDAIRAREVRTVKRLGIDAWPDHGSTAFCVSSQAKRLPER
jgi:hypothetical protein